MADKQWTLAEIIEDWLKAHDYDGLCIVEPDGDGCGCGLSDGLCPCDDPNFRECEAAYKHGEGGYGPNKKFRTKKEKPDVRN